MKENPKFTPVTTLRPHHVYYRHAQEALVGWKNPREIAFEAVRDLLRTPPSPAAYLCDVLGRKNEGSYQGIERHRDQIQGFFDQLRALNNASFLQLDLEPDGICKACIRGKHCMATNYKTEDGDVFSIQQHVTAEVKNTTAIREQLERKGFKEGKDFVLQNTKHKMFDFEGRELDDPTPGIPQVVTFNSLIVRVGALRTLLSS